MSFDTSIQVEREGEDVESSVIYSSDGDHDDFEPPKNILSVLEEVTEAVEEVSLQESSEQQREQL
jgi:hypothetical protein